MITRSALVKLGYSANKCIQIMQRLNVLGVEAKRQNVITTYEKKGKCGGTQFCEMHQSVIAYEVQEAIEALKEWIPTKCNTERSFWEEVLEELEGMV